MLKSILLGVYDVDWRQFGWKFLNQVKYIASKKLTYMDAENHQPWRFQRQSTAAAVAAGAEIVGGVYIIRMIDDYVTLLMMVFMRIFGITSF